MNSPLLTIKNLSITSNNHDQSQKIINNISFHMKNEILGLVGGSGSGKSMTARAILNLLPQNITYDAKELKLHELNLLDHKVNNFRGSKIGMILQDPKYSLNPVLTVGYQIVETLKTHKKINYSQAKERSIKLLSDLEISDPIRVFNSYPHQLSGGIAQRVMTAMMLAPEPKLLIADEPTSALDQKAELSIINLLKKIILKRNMGLLFISHNLPLTIDFCDRLIVLSKGEIVESCHAKDIYDSKHPYVQKLLNSIPNIKHRHILWENHD